MVLFDVKVYNLLTHMVLVDCIGEVVIEVVSLQVADSLVFLDTNAVPHLPVGFVNHFVQVILFHVGD